MKSRVNKVFLIGNIVLLLLVLFFYRTYTFEKLDSLLLDYNFRETATHQPSEDIIVIAIDNASIEELGQFPWDRSIYSAFLDMVNVEGYEPSAIAFDITFSEPSNDDSDYIFTEALAAYDNVILPVVGITEGEVFRTSVAKQDQLLKAREIIRAYKPFADVTEEAHINRVSSHDGVIRQVWLNISGPDGEVIPTLAYKAVDMAGYDLSKYKHVTDLKKTSDPIAKNTVTVDYNLVTDDFMTVSFVDVLYGEFPSENFKDAIVFVGFTATGLANESGQDSGVTPLERDARLVYVHANIANQLIHQELVQYIPNWLEQLLIVLLFALFMWLPWKFKNIYTFIMFIAAIMIVFISQFYLFKTNNYYIMITSILAAIAVAYLFNLSLKAYQEQQQKNFVTRQFGRYISPDLVNQIVKKGMDIELGGSSKHITVLFLDIRGFTSLSEKLTPAEVVDVLNTKFTMITNTALQFGGTIDKFIGDAAMILFNAPLDLENHEAQAIRTGYQIQKNMKPIRDQLFEKYGVEVNIGIGIHAGPVVIGNIGSYLRMDYTAIGDTVNTASRIESGTKGGQVLVSEDVYEQTKHIADYGEPQEKLFKGKSQSIKVYELLNVKEG